MKKPAVLVKGDPVTTVGRVFDTPLVVKGWTWLPLIELIAWLGLAWHAGQRRPERTWLQCLGVGALTMPVALGSEWLHNLAHAAAARAIHKPMDALRITWGMPLVQYYELNDLTVTPRQHLWRALGGPLLNGLLLALSWLWRRRTRPDSLEREVAEAALGANALIVGAGLLPIPGLDGGAALKWGLVARGQTVAQADAAVQKVNGAVSGGLAGGAAAALVKRRWALGGLLALLAGLAGLVATGLLKEQ